MTTVDAPASAAEQMRQEKDSNFVLAGQILCVIVPLVIWFSPIDLAPQIKHGFAILAFMVIAWITQATEFALAGFIGCFLFWALGVVRFDVAFSGFANDTAWFLFAAMLIGLIASKSGLARRLAFTVMLRVGITYPRILLGLIITDFLLTFIVPSGLARVVILASIALALVEAYQAVRGSNIARGMFLILTYTGNIFDKMILAGAGSITAAGLMQKVGGVEVLWGVWLFAFLPCSIVTVLVAWRLTLWLYPPEQTAFAPDKAYFQNALDKMGPWSLAETKAAILITCAILLWVTDFLHHIPPTMVALGVGLFALLPHVGVLEADDMRRLNYMPVFFVAEAVSMGNVLEATKGLDVLTNGVFHWIEPLLDEYLQHYGRALLGCVRLSFPVGQRDLHAGNVNPVGHGICQNPRPQSASARADLDLRGRRQAVRLPIWRFDRRIFLRLFRSARSGQDRRLADCRGIHHIDAAGAVLLAAARHSLNDQGVIARCNVCRGPQAAIRMAASGPQHHLI